MTKDQTLKILENSILSELEKALDLEVVAPEVFSAAFIDLFERVKKSCQEYTLKTYRSTAPEMLQRHREEVEGFEERCFKRWKQAFDHIEMMWWIAQELGEMHGEEIKAEDGDDNNVIMAALAHLFPRALLLTREVICLLKGGFPDGALARWRSLHEISVTGMYVEKNGEEAATAYLLSFHFAARRAAHQMNEHSERAGINRVSEDELLKLDKRCSEAERLLGRVVKSDRDGEWPAITGTHTNFADVEKDVNMDHWRPYYKWASTHTHASHRPIDKLLGMLESSDNVNLIGPSNSGFVAPFQMTAISLAQITATYLLHLPNPDRIVHSSIMLKLADEMHDIAVEAERLSRSEFEDRRKDQEPHS
jgi:hypothetical protein